MKSRKWLAYGLKLLGQRDYTWNELSFRLEKKGAGAEDRKEVRQYLLEKGYLREEQLVSQLVEQQLKRGRGLLYIKNLLERRKVEKEVISQVIGNFDYEAELSAARDYLERCRRKCQKDFSELRLRSRGFSAWTIERLREHYRDQEKFRN
ncbi:MAG: RecX family transcriptional regulator [Candidatus Omnitrophica bacterium]|nr:RecX family transcriptional regulator [Candidatus Omnitrophota bacterium]